MCGRREQHAAQAARSAQRLASQYLRRVTEDNAGPMIVRYSANTAHHEQLVVRGVSRTAYLLASEARENMSDE